jgi:hypothetical protein
MNGGQDRHFIMKTNLWFILAAFLVFAPLPGQTQVRGPGEFQITKITKNLISSPQFSYGGAEQHPPTETERWLEVEVEFAAAPEFTNELTVKYFILFNGTLLTGEATHVNIPAGRERRSVVYVAPRTLVRFGAKRPITLKSIQNVAVQIVEQGAVKDELSLARAQPQWYSTLPQIAGLVLNKNETPFAPLYWDRYEQIKSR